MFEDVVDLLRVQPAVQGNQYATGSGYGKVRLKQRRRIGTEESDAIILVQTTGTQMGGQAIDALAELAVGILPVGQWSKRECSDKVRGKIL